MKLKHFIINLVMLGILIGCTGVRVTKKEIKVIQYYQVKKERLHDEIVKIVYELGNYKKYGSDYIDRLYKGILSSSASYHLGSPVRISADSFSIIKYTGMEAKKLGREYPSPVGTLKTCSDKKLIAHSVSSFGYFEGGDYLVAVFATSKDSIGEKYDLRRMKNICFFARSSSMFGNIESNLIKIQ